MQAHLYFSNPHLSSTQDGDSCPKLPLPGTSLKRTSVEQVYPQELTNLLQEFIALEDDFDPLNQEEDPKQVLYKTLQARAAATLTEIQKDSFFFQLSQNSSLDHTYRSQAAKEIKDPALENNAFFLISQDRTLNIFQRKNAVNSIKEPSIKDQAWLELIKKTQENIKISEGWAKSIQNPSTRDEAFLELSRKNKKNIEIAEKLAATINDLSLKDKAYLELFQSSGLMHYPKPVQLALAIQDSDLRDNALMHIAQNPNLAAKHCLEAIENINNIEYKNRVSFDSSQSSQFCMVHRLRAAALISDPALKNTLLSPSGHLRYKEDFHKPWLDLRPSDCYFTQSNNTTAFKDTYFEAFIDNLPLLKDDIAYAHLKNCIDAYHSIPKTEEGTLIQRIKALTKIAKEAASYIKKNKTSNPLEASDKNCLQAIIVRANLKTHYLQQLIGLEAEAKNRVYLLPGEGHFPHSPLVASTIHSLQTIDPAKREGLHDLYTIWKTLPSHPIPQPNFWLWLEGQDTTHLHSDLRHSFISEKLKKIIFKEGLAYNEIFRSFEPNSKGLIEDGSYIYTISQEGHLYVVPDDENQRRFSLKSKILFTPPLKSKVEITSLQTNLLKHDTILNGKTILCAGIVKFKGGKIVAINNNSGHYEPDFYRNLPPALAYLLSKNPGAIEDTTSISNYKNDVQYTYSVFKNSVSTISNSLKNIPNKVSMETLGFHT